MLADAATRARVQPQHKLFGETLAKLSCAKSRNQMRSDRGGRCEVFCLDAVCARSGAAIGSASEL